MMKQLAEAIQKKDAPIAVGLDTTLDMVPARITEAACRVYGTTLEAAGQAILAFNKEIIDAVLDLVPAVKLQSAMYEKYGIPGITAYRDTIVYCKQKGLIVIGDVKRGDIGSTSEAYASAHLGRVDVFGVEETPFGADIVTVNPYLGTDGVKPFLEACEKWDKGIFVLVKTSNPSSGEFQDRIVDGRPLYELVAEKVEQWGGVTEDHALSNVGAVVGATYPATGLALREQMPHTMLLVPGYGAQGATGADLKHFFREDKTGAIINSSRGIICACREDRYAHCGDDCGAAAREAVLDMKRDITEGIG